MVEVYLQALKGKIFKILPTYEDDPEKSRRYIKLLHCELMGAASLFSGLQEKVDFIDILSIVSFLANDDSYNLPTLKQLVFSAIDNVKKLESQFDFQEEGL